MFGSELREEMERLVEAEAFIETAEFSGNQYGTTKQAVQQVLDSGTVRFLNHAYQIATYSKERV
jgi:guanylate kinase